MSNVVRSSAFIGARPHRREKLLLPPAHFGGGCAGGGDEGESRAGSPTWMAGALSVGNRIFSRAPVRCVRGSWPPPAALGLCYVY